MLSGMELTTSQTLLIAVVGMIVVLLELGVLALFIVIVSKIINAAKGGAGDAPKAKAAPAAAPVPAPAVAAAPMPVRMPAVSVVPVGGAAGQGGDEEVVAAIAAAVAAAHSGRRS